MKTMDHIHIDSTACKGCHLCVDQCPKGVLTVSERRNAKGYLLPQVGDIAACIGCLNCELICPDLALEVIPAKGGEEK